MHGPPPNSNPESSSAAIMAFQVHKFWPLIVVSPMDWFLIPKQVKMNPSAFYVFVTPTLDWTHGLDPVL